MAHGLQGLCEAVAASVPGPICVLLGIRYWQVLGVSAVNHGT